MLSTLLFISVVVVAVVATSTPVPCCYPQQYKGIYYNKIITHGKDGVHHKMRTVKTHVDYVNNIEFNKISIQGTEFYKYQVLTDYSDNGQVYVTAYGTCLFKTINTEKQNDRCRFCNAYNYGPFHYGAGNNKFNADYYVANFTTETFEGTPINPTIHATMIHVDNDTIVPILEYGTYGVVRPKGQAKIQYTIDHTNYVLQIEDENVFNKPEDCQTMDKVSTDELIDMILKEKSDVSDVSSDVSSDISSDMSSDT